MGRFHICVLFSALVFLVSCSGDGEPEENDHKRGDHVWKYQVESIDRARDVEGVLKDATEKNKDNLEQQLQ